jgi:hypothetical protein
MKKVKVKTNGLEVECNYTKNVFELIDGLFLDKSKPLIMEFDYLLRPITISTKSRRGFNLPILSILTFDKDFNIIRKLDKIQNNLKIQMMFKEKYVFEIPNDLKLPKEIFQIKKLQFKEIK